MDGGSVSLEAIDTTGRLLRITLDWSIDAQRRGATRLAVDGLEIRPGSAEEAGLIESLRGAQVTGADEPADIPPPKRVAFARDAKAYLEAIDRGPRSALSALRDDLLRKVESPVHKREVRPRFLAPGESRRSGPLPLP